MTLAEVPPLRVDAARNVERIVDAAYAVFADARQPPSMEDVASAAGVGVATVYRRFPTREDLLRTVLDRRWRRRSRRRSRKPSRSATRAQRCGSRSRAPCGSSRATGRC